MAACQYRWPFGTCHLSRTFSKPPTATRAAWKFHPCDGTMIISERICRPGASPANLHRRHLCAKRTCRFLLGSWTPKRATGTRFEQVMVATSAAWRPAASARGGCDLSAQVEIRLGPSVGATDARNELADSCLGHGHPSAQLGQVLSRWRWRSPQLGEAAQVHRVDVT